MVRRTTGRLLAEIRFNPERRQRRIGTPDRTEQKRTKRAGGTPRVFFGPDERGRGYGSVAEGMGNALKLNQNSQWRPKEYPKLTHSPRNPLMIEFPFYAVWGALYD